MFTNLYVVPLVCNMHTYLPIIMYCLGRSLDYQIIAHGTRHRCCHWNFGPGKNGPRTKLFAWSPWTFSLKRLVHLENICPIYPSTATGKVVSQVVRCGIPWLIPVPVVCWFTLLTHVVVCWLMTRVFPAARRCSSRRQSGSVSARINCCNIMIVIHST